MKRALLAALILGLFGSTARAQVTCVGSACGGSGGSGSGDLLSTNNLSDVASASTSLSNLGGQPLNATLTSISSVTFAADKCLYFTAATTVAAFNCTSFGRSIVNAADAAALRTLAALGTMATQAASSVSITGGTITGITDLVVADGGTGVSSLTAYAPIFGGTTSTGAVQSGTVGTSGQCLTSNGAGALPTFQACSGGGSTVTLGGATSGFASPTIIASVSNLLAAYTLSGTGTVLPTTVSPTFTTPALGTPSAVVLTSGTGLPISTGVSGLGTGVATFLGTPSSANLISAVTDETGSGALVFATSPTLVTPILGTPTSGTLTNATGLPISTGVSGLGSNVATFLATPSSANLAAAVTDETGSGAAVFATSPTLVTPILGTPTSGTLTNATGLPISTGVSGLGSGVATFLATPSSANLATAVTDETGSGAAVFATSPTLVTPLLGTPTSGVMTNVTGTATGLTSGITNALKSATTTVDVSAATAPTTGQALIATGASAATWQTLAGGGNAQTANPLSQFAATTSAQFAGVISDESGTGLVILQTSPTLVTPALGTPTALVGTNITGTAAGLTAGNVTTNANLTGPVTSTGNATAITDGQVVLADLADLAQDQFIGRTTASTGVPQTATITSAARTVLDDTTVGAMVDTLGGATSTGTGGIARATSPTFVTPLLGTPTSGVMTNVTGTATGLTSGITNALKSATTTVDVSAATAPTSGQVLTATAGTTATWQTPGAGGITCADTGVVFADGANTPACDAGMTYNKTTDAITLVGSAIAPVFKSAVGANVAVQATAPTATTGASQAGKTADVTASAAIASTDTAGAAAGGAVTITSGAAARLTSGNAAGGAINLVTGAGIGTGVAGQVIVPAGTSAFPSLSNSQNTGTGIWWRSGSAINVSVNSTAYFGFTNVGSGEFVVNSGAQIGFVSSNVTAANMDTGFARVSAGVMRATNASTEIRALIGGGAAVASATALPVPTGRVFHVTGTTVVTSITSTNFGNGAVITLIFDGILTMTDGNNLVLAGNFVTTADDTLTLVYDGTNWYEIARSVN